MPNYQEDKRETPIVHDVDVVVAGGGCAGVTAAVAAARNGADTLLVERYGFLGGASTNQYVPLLSIWNLTPWDKEKIPLIAGLAQEKCRRLDEKGGSIRPEEALKAQRKGTFPDIWFYHDFEVTKIVDQEMCEEAGVKLLLHTHVTDAILEKNTVEGIIVENKTGRQAITAKVTVDTTGDGDIAARAGADYQLTKGSQIVNNIEKGIMAVSYIARVSAVNQDKLRQALKEKPYLISNLMKEKAPDLIDDTIIYTPLGEKPALYEGPRAKKIPEPFHSNPKYNPVTRPGETTIGLIHSYGRDITNAQDNTEAELELRKKIWRLFNFYKENIPGYENAYIVTTPPHFGLRESRRITGDYTLTEEDMLIGTKFDDAILRNRIGEWDLDETGKTRDTSQLTPPFEIPYRCIVPKKIDGLIIAGRCISITHEAATYFTPRDIVTAWGLGEAAGTAAALSAKKQVQPRSLDVKTLQTQLKSQGFNLR